jgi:hypothetical protein
LERIRGSKVKDIPVSMGFRFKVDNPYYRIWKGDMGLTEVRFSRDPDGSIHLGSDADEDGMEWLGSYYTGSGREFSDSERWNVAILGAQKLYNLIANMPITNINEDY